MGMALKHLPLIFLFSLLLSSSPLEIEARDSQMFNKIPSKKNDVEVEVQHPQQNLPKQEEEPNFIPQNTENNYGLYGHEYGQFPPSTQTQNNNKYFPNAKYLPKNYNTKAYVTQPQDFNENSYNDNSYTNTPTNNYNNYQTQDNSNKYYNAKKTVMNNGFDSMDTEEDTFDNDDFNNDDVSNDINNFNTRFMDVSETTNNNKNYFRSGKSRVNRVEGEGMSDTRLMENGKYHYDIKSGRYNNDHPYVNPMAMRNQYNNIDNSNQYNNFNAEEDQYQNEDNMP